MPVENKNDDYNYWVSNKFCVNLFNMWPTKDSVKCNKAIAAVVKSLYNNNKTKKKKSIDVKLTRIGYSLM